MAITPDTPTVAQDVPTPMETSPVQNPQTSTIGMELGGELELVGEMLEPLQIVEVAPVDDAPQTEGETTVNCPREKTPTVASEKGSSSAAKSRGKITKAMTDGPRRKSRRLGSGKCSPSVQPPKKRRTVKFINLSDVEDEETSTSPTNNAAQTAAVSGSSGSEFDDTESDKDFKTTDGDDEATSSDDESLASDETLGAWVNKKKEDKRPKSRSVPTSKPTAGSTSIKGKEQEPIDVESDSEIEAYDGYHPSSTQ